MVSGIHWHRCESVCRKHTFPAIGSDNICKFSNFFDVDIASCLAEGDRHSIFVLRKSDKLGTKLDGTAECLDMFP